MQREGDSVIRLGRPHTKFLVPCVTAQIGRINENDNIRKPENKHVVHYVLICCSWEIISEKWHENLEEIKGSIFEIVSRC